MTDIVLIRHGETAWNAIRRLQGHLDIPLNAEGRRQAEALGRALSAERFDAVYASDLLRARQTAQRLVRDRDMPVLIDPGLRERCFGAFEGMLYAEIGARFPQDWAAWSARDPDARFPPGVHPAETLREFSQRAVGSIARIANLHRGRKIAVVTHGGVLECAYRAAQGIGFAQARDFDILNAGVNRFLWNGDTLQLVEWCDVAHLEAPGTVALDEMDSRGLRDLASATSSPRASLATR